MNPRDDTSVLQELENLVERARGEISQLERERAAIDRQLERLRGVAGLSTTEIRTPYTRKGLQTVITIAERILALDSGSRFTVQDIQAHTPEFSSVGSTVRSAIQYLTDIGFTEDTGKTGNARTWRILNPEVLDTLRAELEARG